MLSLDIYGLKVQVNFRHHSLAERTKLLLSNFLTKPHIQPDVTLYSKKKKLPRAICSELFPHLALRSLWGIHAAGINLKGGYLVLGPSGSGKSTLAHLAVKAKIPIVSDDILLLQESTDGVVMLPLFSSIHLKSKEVSFNRHRAQQKNNVMNNVRTIIDIVFSVFRPMENDYIIDSKLMGAASLNYLIFIHHSNESTRIVQEKSKSRILKNVTSQLLWSYDQKTQAKQKKILKFLCEYPAYNLYLGRDVIDTPSRLETIFHGL